MNHLPFEFVTSCILSDFKIRMERIMLRLTIKTILLNPVPDNADEL